MSLGRFYCPLEAQPVFASIEEIGFIVWHLHVITSIYAQFCAIAQQTTDQAQPTFKSHKVAILSFVL